MWIARESMEIYERERNWIRIEYFFLRRILRSNIFSVEWIKFFPCSAIVKSNNVEKQKFPDKIHVVDNRLWCDKFGLRKRKVDNVILTFQRRGGAHVAPQMA